MASIRKRKSRTSTRAVAEGMPHVGTEIIWAPPAGGFVRAVGTMFTLVVDDHVVHLTEDEMLETMSGWLQKLSDIRRDRAKKAREYAERNA